MAYLFLKYIHLLGATVLLGTGLGIAFFMLLAHRTGDVGHISRTATTVVLADFLFTAVAVVIQPLTGVLLAHQTGLPLTEERIVASVALYVVTGVFWLPVVYMQIRMRDLARSALARKEPLPAEYHRVFRRWFLCGFPGFGSVAAIMWLMLAKPSF
jgi:uncharacterized membrane protein